MQNFSYSAIGNTCVCFSFMKIMSIAGLVIGRIGMEMTGPHDNFAPPFSFSFCSMSNILSSWFQYEALKFITFPMQVLSKSCKIIAAMLMGKFLNGSTFTNMEIFNAVVITAGLFVYKYGQSKSNFSLVSSS